MCRRRVTLLVSTAALIMLSFGVITAIVANGSLPSLDKTALSWSVPSKQTVTIGVEGIRFADADALLPTEINSTIAVTNPSVIDDAPGQMQIASARASGFTTLSNLYVTLIAFAAAAGATVFASLQGSRELYSNLSQLDASLYLAVGAILGLFLVLMDPIGPIVSHDLTLFGGGEGAMFFDKKPFSIIAHAKDATAVDSWTVRAVSFSIMLSGVLAGITVAAVMVFFFLVVKRDIAIESLQKRKKHLLSVIAASSISLSLGVAMIHMFLNWGGDYLSEPYQKVIAPMAQAGSAYWAGMFAIFTFLTAGWTAYRLHSDINDASAGQRDPKGKEIAPGDWKKAKDLDFDPLKSVSTLVLALSPVITSTLLTSLGASLGG